jgi:peptidoglycan/LPS O-acetylase OafA/YrhL
MGSMLVFVTVLGIARMQTWVKISVLSYLFYWCHHTVRWEPATFIVGILLAEISFIRTKYSASPSSCLISLSANFLTGSKLSRYLESAGKVIWTTLFLFGLYAGSHPQASPSTTPGYRTLMSLVPSQYSSNAEIFWLAIGGVIVVFALESAPHLQALFTTPFAQYLGDISFSLYMLHTMVMCTLGTWLAPKAMNFTGGWANGQTGFIGGMALVVAVTGPVTFLVSDLFSRAVDERCVRFARWVSGKCFVKAP